MRANPDIMQGIAPIFGKELCCFIPENCHIKLSSFGDIGSRLYDGFAIGIDIQPEGADPSILFGTGVSSKTSLIATYNANGVKNRVQLDLMDDRGSALSVYAQLSRYAAKRLVISVDVQDQCVKFHELNLLPSEETPQTEYVKRDGPKDFSNFSYDMIIGGACIDGERRGQIATKVGNFFVSGNALTKDKVRAFLEAPDS